MGVGNFPATNEGLNNLGAEKRCTIPWKARTQKARNLLDQSLRSKERVELLCEFLHELLVFVQPICM